MAAARIQVTICRRPLLLLTLIIIAIFVFRAFLNVRFGDGSRNRSGEISMLTLNIWYSSEKMQERMEAVGELVQDLDPDFLIFQEVAQNNLLLLEKQGWFSRYYLIPPKADTLKRIEVGKSCAVILSRYVVNNWQQHAFNSFGKYRRAFVAGEFDDVVPSIKTKLVVAGTHLSHDVPRSRIREEQLKEALQILNPYKNVCFMGDLNILDEVDGEVVLPSPWFDAWLSLPGNTHSSGYTFAHNTSPFASVRKRNGTSKGRLDRILCKFSDFEVKEMKVVGNKLTKSGILPSDHFGVFAIIKPTTRTNRRRKVSQTESEEVYFKGPLGLGKVINPKDM